MTTHPESPTRRRFLQTAASAFVAGGWSATRPPRVLLRSSWQVVNIGDIAHTPGVLALLERHVPGCEVVLWASGDFSPQVEAMERRRFPALRVVKGRIGADGRADNTALADAVSWADFLLHGSGPSLVGAADVAAFVRSTAKPFGVYGITHGSFLSGDDASLLSRAAFVFFRDSVSLARAKAEGVRAPVMEFGPDGAFACDLRNDTNAEAFLAAHDLRPGGFLCCLSRLRYTPYWTIPGDTRPRDPARDARNQAMKEHDHLPLREAIIAVVRGTGLKVLLCPEDMTQMAVGKEMFWDVLPDDVRSRVVWRNEFWLTDEALSTYVRSAGLFGSEMHSPIMAVGNGIPAIVCRFEEQTSKGIMWRDIGLGDWLFDLDREEDVRQIVPAVMAWRGSPLRPARRPSAPRPSCAPASARRWPSCGGISSDERRWPQAPCQPWGYDPDMEAIRHLAYCGRCGADAGTQTDNWGGPFRCPACGFTLFFNAAGAVAAIIGRADGHALFVRRAKDPAKGKLGMPGGFIDPGESGEEALAREVREEVGLELRDMRYLSSYANAYDFAGVRYHTVDLFFVATVDDPDAAQALDAVDAVEWMDPLTMALEEVAFESMRAALRTLRDSSVRR